MIWAYAIASLGLLISWYFSALQSAIYPDPYNYYIFFAVMFVFFFQMAPLYGVFPLHGTILYLALSLGVPFVIYVADPSAFARQPSAFLMYAISLPFAYVFTLSLRNLVIDLRTGLFQEKHAREQLSETKSILDISLEESNIGIICFNDEGKQILSNNIMQFMPKQSENWAQDQFLDYLNENFQPDIPETFEVAIPIVIDERHILLSCKATKSVMSYSFVDVTEQHHWQMSLNTAQKMKMIGELTSGMAHDYNNILAIAMNSLSAFPKTENEELWGEYLEPVSEALSHAKSISRKLLTIGGKRKLETRFIDPAQSVQEIQQFLYSVLGPKVRLKMQCNKGMVIETDPDELNAAVLNLVINSKNAMGEKGGVVKITVEEREGRCFVEVEDDGAGIPKAIQKHIFDPFVTTKTDHYSTGLGLTMVKGFVDQTGGEVSFSSNAQRTVFSIIFPISTHAESRVLDHEDGRICHDENDKKLLFVDDNPQLIQSTKRLMKVKKANAEFAHNQCEALEVFRANPDIDFAFLDLTMPDVDGITLGRKLREINADLPIVILTGHASDGLIEEIRDAGFQGVVFKPARVDVLLDVSQRKIGEEFFVLSK